MEVLRYCVVKYIIPLITTEQKESTSSGVGIFVAAITAGVKGKEENESIETNRIKFSVPLIFDFDEKNAEIAPDSPTKPASSHSG